jgi:nucleotide-binding universal stress UspA family protein
MAYASQVLDRAKILLQKQLIDLFPTSQRGGVQVHSEVRLGYASEVINAFASGEEFDLIVMATHGRNAVMRGILGSVADKVLRTSTVPVLLVKPEAEGPEDRLPSFNSANILMPIDGSVQSEAALPYVEALASALGSKVTVLRVIDTGDPNRGLLEDRAEGVYPEIQERAANDAGAIVSLLREKGVVASAKIAKGSPADSVIEVANETDADLIVLSPKGLSGLARVWLGSVTETAVRTSHRPVFVVPPPFVPVDSS